MSKHIVVSNEKGGVGKSTTAVNLAHGLSLRGRSVLLIDFDPQGSASRHLRHEPTPATRKMILGDESPKRLAVEVRPNLHLLSSNVELADVRDYLAMKMGRDPESARGALAQALDGLRGYDYIVTDCSPAVDVLTINAMMAGDELLVPVSADFLSAVGTEQHLQTLKLVEELGSDIELGYIVPTRFDGRTKRARRILELLQDAFGEELVTNPIRVNTSIAEAAHFGKTIFEHAPNSNGAADYAALVETVDNER